MKKNLIRIIFFPGIMAFWTSEKFGNATSIEGYTTWYRAVGWFLLFCILATPMLSPVIFIAWLFRD